MSGIILQFEGRDGIRSKAISIGYVLVNFFISLNVQEPNASMILATIFDRKSGKKKKAKKGKEESQAPEGSLSQPDTEFGGSQPAIPTGTIYLVSCPKFLPGSFSLLLFKKELY